MGFFTTDKQRKSAPPPKPCFIDPPNVYYSPNVHQSSPPPRPATAAPAPLPSTSQSLLPAPYPAYHNQHANASRPLLQPTGWPPQQPQQPGYALAPPQQRQLRPQKSQWRLDLLAGNVVPLCDDLCSRFDDIMTLIDLDKLCGNEKVLFSYQMPSYQPLPSPPQLAPSPPPPESSSRGLVNFSMPKKKLPQSKKPKAQSQPSNVTTSVLSGNYFSKVELYANSKVPRDLPPLALYIPTWPLICLAAQYSHRVYTAPTGSERDAHVSSSSWLSGTKAMVIKSVPMDHMQTIVFAIRGTASFSDWAVNLRSAPASPAGFLDDPGNLCHAGFLSVARKMIRPVAARLRDLLREDPGRKRCSLIITGHSAGGAVAALLYCHMLARTTAAESELNVLMRSFKRVHCVTFGTPPVSLLPLMRPDRPELRKSLFLSFINEGDPVVRADKAYVKSLLELLAAPPPPSSTTPQPSKTKTKTKPKTKGSPTPSNQPIWPVPIAPLSNAGRLIILRSGTVSSSSAGSAPAQDRKTVPERLDDGVLAVTCREGVLRGVIWGDPVCHLMSLYAGRVEMLAVGAVTAKKG